MRIVLTGLGMTRFIPLDNSKSKYALLLSRLRDGSVRLSDICA